jgi:DNA uptake protein ComE-like DNA-binding protein
MKGFFAGVGSLATLVLVAGCNGSAPTQQQVQQQAAQTTVAAKQGAKEAVAATKQAAAVAVQDVNSVAAGVKEGIRQDTPNGSAKSSTKANLNTSTQLRLAMLPGISMSKAGEIVDQRPYSSKRQLVSKGLLTEEQYARIADDVTTK